MSEYGFSWNTKNYDMKGEKNKRINSTFIKICKMNKVQLKKYLEKELSKYYKNVISQDGFLYVKGKDKICLTAHMDTVHAENVIDYYVYKEEGKTIVSSPQGIGGDDRCGIFMIMKILERTKMRPTIIFCEDEEIGCVGSTKFTRTKFIKDLEKMYFLIELDRKGNKDLVYYSDANKEFHEYLENLTEYEAAWGTCSDISTLSPVCGISSVNISCGYYNAHTTSEYVVLEEMENSIETTIKIMKDGLKKKEQYEYKTRTYSFSRNDDYDYIYPRNFYNSLWGNDENDEENDDEMLMLYIQWEKDGIEKDDAFYGDDEYELWYQFFTQHGDVCYNDILDYYIDDMNEIKDETENRKLI